MLGKLTTIVAIIAFFSQAVHAAEPGDTAYFSIKIRFRIDESKCDNANKNKLGVYADCLIVNQGENLVGIGGIDLAGAFRDGNNFADMGTDSDKSWLLEGSLQHMPGVWGLLEPKHKHLDEIKLSEDVVFVPGSSVLVSLPIDDPDNFVGWVPHDISNANPTGELDISLMFWVLTANNDSRKMKTVRTDFDGIVRLSKFAWNKWFTLHEPKQKKEKYLGSSLSSVKAEDVSEAPPVCSQANKQTSRTMRYRVLGRKRGRKSRQCPFRPVQKRCQR